MTGGRRPRRSRNPALEIVLILAAFAALALASRTVPAPGPAALPNAASG